MRGAVKSHIDEIMALYDELGSIRATARAMGVNYTGVRDRITRELARRQAEQDLESAGYQLDPSSKTPEEAWQAHKHVFERKVGKSIGHYERTIRRHGPFVIFHATDEHVDDDASALMVLEADIRASHDMNAIMCHGGDLLNNWPVAGKLAKQWAEQACTLPDALLRAQHFIEMFQPDVWVDGNHEEMNPYLINLFETWMPDNVIRDYWRCNFVVETPERDIRVSLSHKFSKGSSWFHGLHGHIREALQSDERDLYMDGHYHQAATMYYHLPERSHSCLLVASAGYKMVDKWATRISRGGKLPHLPGRAHWIVCDPFADPGAQMCHAFEQPQLAEAFFNTLQNLREV